MDIGSLRNKEERDRRREKTGQDLPFLEWRTHTI